MDRAWVLIGGGLDTEALADLLEGQVVGQQCQHAHFGCRQGGGSAHADREGVDGRSKRGHLRRQDAQVGTQPDDLARLCQQGPCATRVSDRQVGPCQPQEGEDRDGRRRRRQQRADAGRPGELSPRAPRSRHDAGPS